MANPSYTITVERLTEWEACYNEDKLRDLVGDGITAIQVAAMTGVSVVDRIWCLLHEPIFTARELRILACRWANQVLPIYEAAYPGDDRPRNAIKTARRYADGLATEEELTVAAWAAAAAAGAAAAAAAAEASWAGASWAAAEASWAAAEAKDERLTDVVAILEGTPVESL